MNHKKWEYKILYTIRSKSHRELTEIFNELGSLGWEAVGYVMNDGANGRYVCFKRELGYKRVA